MRAGTMSLSPASPESGPEWKMDEYVLNELMGPLGVGEHSRALSALPTCPQIPLPFLHTSTSVQPQIPSPLSAHKHRYAAPGVLSLSQDLHLIVKDWSHFVCVCQEPAVPRNLCSF